MEKTLEQKLLEKKQGLEKLLADKLHKCQMAKRWIEELETSKKSIENDRELERDLDDAKWVLEEEGLLVEVIDEAVRQIDNYLKYL